MAQAVELNGKKILVTFLMHLGDLTLTTPFIHALRKAAPDAHITFLADEKLKDVVLHNPYLDEVITIDKKGKDNSLLALMACARRLSKMDFDVLINLHPNERCSFIDAFTKVKLRCGTTHTLFKPLWDVFTPLNRKIHAADMYLDVLTQLGVQKLEHNGLEIFPSEEYQQHAEEFWREHGVFATDKLVGFNIGSAVVTKRWAPERFAKVADILAEKGYKPVFFGGTMDEEMVQEAVSFMKTTPVVCITYIFHWLCNLSSLKQRIFLLIHLHRTYIIVCIRCISIHIVSNCFCICLINCPVNSTITMYPYISVIHINNKYRSALRAIFFSVQRLNITLCRSAIIAYRVKHNITISGN